MCQSQLQQMTNSVTSFLVFDENKEWYFMKIVMKYHALFDTFEKAAKFEIVICCKL